MFSCMKPHGGEFSIKSLQPKKPINGNRTRWKKRRLSITVALVGPRTRPKSQWKPGNEKKTNLPESDSKRSERRESSGMTSKANEGTAFDSDGHNSVGRATHLVKDVEMNYRKRRPVLSIADRFHHVAPHWSRQFVTYLALSVILHFHQGRFIIVTARWNHVDSIDDLIEIL